MVGDIWVMYFSKLKMAGIEFSSDNNFYIKRWNLTVSFHFENRQVFLPHPVLYYKNVNRNMNITALPWKWKRQIKSLALV